jgi:hypothetical protein
MAICDPRALDPLAMLAFGTVRLCDALVLSTIRREADARGRESIVLGDRLATVDPYLKPLANRARDRRSA